MRRLGPVAAGYAPFLVLAAVLAAFVTVLPSKSSNPRVDTFDGATNGTAVGSFGDVDDGEGFVPGAVGGAVGSAQTGQGAGPATRGAGAGAGGAAGGSAGGRPAGWDHREPGPWPWTHAADMPGDRGKCAEGGLVQDVTTPTRIQCVPRYTLDNGGATYQGVTKDTVRIVNVVNHADVATAVALGAADLAASDEERQDAMNAYVEYFNKHFELYGRKIEFIWHYAECDLNDPVCQRNEANTVQQKYKPFFIGNQSNRKALSEEMAKRGVVSNTYAGAFSQKWYAAHQPYVWSMYPSIDALMAIAAEYFCKKMDGKPPIRGVHAPAVTERKVGLVVADDPDIRPAGERMVRALSGERCGSADDKPALFTTSSSDLAQLQAQMPAIVTGMRQEGVTTVVLTDPFTPIFFTREADNQQFFPEYLLPGECNMTHDYLARLYSASQWNNAFGLSCRPREAPVEQSDFVLAYRDVRGQDAPIPRYITYADFLWMRVLVHQLQWAGPNLNPGTLARGSYELPQVGGYTPGPNVWPGWVCCNPYVERWGFTPAEPNAFVDYKEEYYSSTDNSEIDGRPGTYTCVNDCRRYGPGDIPSGDPLT